MANNNKIERAAVRAVEEYIDECPKLEPLLSKNDKTPIYDGSIYLYKNYNHKIGNYYATLPVQVKGTNSTKDSYRIDREYIEGYRIDKGCIFFLVQEKIRPIKVLYAILTPAELDHLLQQKTKTIRIDLDVVPADPNVFESELFAFAAKRNGEKTEDSSPKEIAILVEGFEKMRGYIGEIKDKGVYYELETSLDIIKNTKDDGTIGWRDKFIYYSRKALHLAINHLKDHDFTYLQGNFGVYLYNQRLYHLVEDYHFKTLEEYRKRKNNANVATALNNMANLHADLMRYKEAEQEYQEALEIRRRLTKTNRDENIEDLAMLLNNMGNLHKVLIRFEEAEQEYQEALEIYRGLAETNRIAHIHGLATILNNLALLHNDLTNYERAEQEFHEALKYYRELAETNCDVYIGDVAMALNNLGELYRVLNRFDEAEQEYHEALEIRRELAVSNRCAYIADVAGTLNNLGILHRDLMCYDEAEREQKEALEIRRELAMTNRDAYIGKVAQSLNNLAILHDSLKRYKEAEMDFREALTYYRELASKNREAYIREVANTLNNLAVLHKELTRYQEAEQEYQEALIIRRELAKTNRETYIVDIADTLYNYAILLQMDEKRKDEAKAAAIEALGIYKELAKKYPQIWNSYVGNTQRLLDELNVVKK
jgi:tetratricopeptide (TPR) repeat protein